MPDTAEVWGTPIKPLIDPVPTEAAPQVPIPTRAFMIDASILLVGITVYVVAMIDAGRLYRTWETPLEAAGLAFGWLVLILAYGGYDRRYVGVGAEEFKRVITASVTLLAVISTAAYIFLPQSPPLRLVIPSLAIGLLALLLGRWRLRVWLGRNREAGRFQTTTLVVGEDQRSALLVSALNDDPSAGYRAVAQVEPPPMNSPGAAFATWLEEVLAWVRSNQVGAVAIADSGGIQPALLRQLAWRLEAPRVELLVSPLLYDVAGPRVSVRPASGLPLLHLDEPVLTGPKRFLKRTMDVVLGALALVVLSPVLILISVAISLDSRGPAQYVSQRIGRSGIEFGCRKFRTMRDGADAQRSAVIGLPDESIAERYRTDPRITRVGRFLRRWSLDELPQLLNVVGGSMSLVGPRPVLPEEMALLADSDRRRHITKPGLTGLWQISGRKEVAWDDRMLMDLYYVEHWSLALDVVILAKTAKAVITGHGAY
ncbi:MAG TPA: sugar transferase [Motilibacterales bacterium]|nr:sugar transferase [Motilibacterales bacterium]